MKSWNRCSDEIKFENGEKVIEYKLEFYTTNKKEILYLEKVFQKLMDKDIDETLGETEKKNNLKKIIDYYGEEKQIIKAIEEMSELQKELCKKLLGKSDRDSLVEEIADVQIMLDQLKLIVSNTELKTIMQNKVDRTIERINQY